MTLNPVWKIGSPSRGRGLHAFLLGGFAGTRAVCSASVLADGVPLGNPKIIPTCRSCVQRLALMEEHGLTEMRKNFAGLIRSKRLAAEAKTHWWVERHGGQRKNAWLPIRHAEQKVAEALFHSEKVKLSLHHRGYRRRGGVRLVDPDGRVEREFLRSPWMKEAARGAEASARSDSEV